MIMAIIANSVVIAMYDRTDRQSKQPFNQLLDWIQLGLTIAFTCETLLKMIGFGVILHKNAYLRDHWNWVDFFTVVVG